MYDLLGGISSFLCRNDVIGPASNVYAETPLFMDVLFVLVEEEEEANVSFSHSHCPAPSPSPVYGITLHFCKMYENGTPSDRHTVAKSFAVSECTTPWTDSIDCLNVSFAVEIVVDVVVVVDVTSYEEGTGSTDAQLGSIPGNPGTLNLKRYPGKIAAVDDIGRSWRKSTIVDDSMLDPYAK